MNKVKFLYALVCSMFLAACSEEENLMPAGRTGIQVALTEKASVETRKTPEELTKPLAKEFHLKITNAAGKSVYDAGYTSELIPASAGTYTVEATYGDNSELAVDAPYYKGETEVEVADGKTAKETIYCKVANALASVEFDNTGAYTFEDQFSSYGVKVEMGNLSTELKGDGESAYYRAGSRPTFTFVGTLKDGGEEVEVSLEDDKFSQAATFAAGAHCVITLKLGASTPGVRVEVSKVEVKNVTINETIPMEWLPKPKVEAEGFDVNNTLTFVETESKNAKLNLNLASALQEMKLKFNFEDPQFATLNEQEYLLSKDKATLESTLGITLPNIDDKEASIDLSALIDKLQTNAGTPTTNALTIDVQANNRWSSEDTEKELTYTLNCNKPEFSVAVQEGNCWAWEFTVDEVSITSGDPEKIKADLVYQYLDGDTWKECMTKEGVLGRVQQFTDDGTRKYLCTEEAPERSYRVRALYRGVIASEEVEVTLEEPWLLPNGNMDNWTESTKKVTYALNSYNQPFFVPWDETVQSWWDTNNNASMPNKLPSIGNASFKCFPATTFANPGSGEAGKAAVIRTVNVNGFGSSSVAALGDDIKGILYAGTTSSNGTISEGRPFTSRPQKLNFDYKYSSYDNECFGVYVEVLSGETTIGKGNYTSATNESITEFTPHTMDIEYSDKTLKATSIKIKFCSVAEGHDPAVQTNIEVEVPEGSGKKYHIHGGSVLYIDNISFDYTISNE